jgi:hypothetical protein
LRALLVVAHPLDNAFAKAAAERIRAMLERRGIEVDTIDLYADDFDPRLTGAERRDYFTTPYDSRAVAGYVARLMLAEKLVFGFIYMLNGDNGASNTDPYATEETADNNWIKTGSHVMIVGAEAKSMMQGYPRDAKPDPTKPYMMWPGTPYEHLMLPVK